MITYLACPYTHADPAVVRRRLDAVNRLAARLIAAGEIVYSPISHSHLLTEAAGLPIDWAFWSAHSLAMLGACDRLLVYCLDGWECSIGVQAEVARAVADGKPVHYHLPEIDAVAKAARPAAKEN